MQHETHSYQTQQNYRRTLGYAEAIAGGVEALASRLRVSSSKVQVWIAGLEEIPDSIFLAIVDVVCDASDEEIRHAREYRGSDSDVETESPS